MVIAGAAGGVGANNSNSIAWGCISGGVGLPLQFTGGTYGSSPAYGFGINSLHSNPPSFVDAFTAASATVPARYEFDFPSPIIGTSNTGITYTADYLMHLRVPTCTGGTNTPTCSTLGSLLTDGVITSNGGMVTNTLSASSTVSGAGFSTYLASPPSIGATTPAAGKFTTLATTGLYTPTSTIGIKGTTAGDTVQAGSVGELMVVNCPVNNTSAAVTFTTASPTVVNWASAPWVITGPTNWTCAINFTGTLPTGIAASTTYYVAGASYNSGTGNFNIASTVALAIANTPDINVTVAGTPPYTGIMGAYSNGTTGVVAGGAIQLTAGDWDCGGQAEFNVTTTATTTTCLPGRPDQWLDLRLGRGQVNHDPSNLRQHRERHQLINSDADLQRRHQRQSDRAIARQLELGRGRHQHGRPRALPQNSIRNTMKFIFKSLLLLLPALALAGEVGNYPNSVGIDSTVRFLADQGGPAGPSTLGTTVNITPAQLQSWLYPLGYLPSSLMPILTGDCSTTTGSFAITCTKTNGVLFSSLATATTPGAVIALFTGCTGTDYLGADGNCHATSGAGTVTSVGLTLPAWLAVSGSPVTTAGAFTVTGTSEPPNYVLASPNGSAGAVSPRALVAADLPTISLTSGVSGTLQAAQFLALTGDVTNTVGTAATTVGKINGAAIPASQSCVGTNGSSQIVAGSCGGSGAFSALTGGTNTAAAMLVGTGASLGPTGTGTLSANQVNGATVPATACAVATNGSNQFTALTCTGSGNNVLATSPTLTTPNLGTPSALTLTNATGLPISSGVSGLATGVATFLATP